MAIFYVNGTGTQATFPDSSESCSLHWEPKNSFSLSRFSNLLVGGAPSYSFGESSGVSSTPLHHPSFPPKLPKFVQLFILPLPAPLPESQHHPNHPLPPHRDGEQACAAVL